ncbi:MAG: hypothetical protein E6575_01000 [Bradyrhizobium sp.]|nr:hypothetical protein [Bradyrhizobium sp.]
MKLLVGAVSASLLAAFAAQAEPFGPAGARAPYTAVSDIDEPYQDLPPPPAAVPAPPRYGYGPGADYGYRDQRYTPPAPVYRQDGYQPDYGYAPAFLPVHEVYAILRDNGFSPLGAPRQRGNVYVVAVLDRDGEDGKLVVDARSGRIIRFVPAFQWGEQYERMRYEPAPRGGLDRLRRLRGAKLSHLGEFGAGGRIVDREDGNADPAAVDIALLTQQRAVLQTFPQAGSRGRRGAGGCGRCHRATPRKRATCRLEYSHRRAQAHGVCAA